MTQLNPATHMFHPERHKVCHTKVDTVDCRYLVNQVEFHPHPDRPKFPWVATIWNPQEMVTSGVFSTQVRAKSWAHTLASALVDYEFVTVKLLTDLEREFQDDFDKEVK